MSDFDSIDDALKDIKDGKMVLVVDDMSEETEGDIIMAAEFVTPGDINFMSRESRGIIAVAGTSERIEELDLEIIGLKTNTLRGIQFGVTIDAIPGTTTGASSKDRATTILLFSDPSSKSSDFAKPGHVTTLKALDGGILSRAGHTEASVDITKLAGLRPAGVLSDTKKCSGSISRDFGCLPS